VTKQGLLVGLLTVGVALLALALASLPAASQSVPDAGGSVASDSLSGGEVGADASLLEPGFELPVYGLVGIGFGNRSDGCVLCESTRDNKSFTAHVSVGRPLGKGFGVGLDASVWRRARPGTPVASEGRGSAESPTLQNILGNLSVSFSYTFWHLFVRAGGGVAYGSQDLEMTGGDGAVMVHRASGFGVGYSAGGGITVPLASFVSLAFFGNWNVGHYDMISPRGLSERGARHRYLELGVGVGVR
jgi:hypothetical protein